MNVLAKAPAALTLCAVGLMGCTGSDPVTSAPISPPPSPVEVPVTSQVDVDLLPPEAPPEAPYRERRRMDIDQLGASVRAVTGGIGWTELRNGREVDLFAELESTLGKPDYLEITEEDLAPSAMFQKFLDDAARSVCLRLVDSEVTRPAAERVFFVHATPTDTLAAQREATVANLQHLLLRFHGRKVAAEAPELEPWRWLMASAEHVTQDQTEVWRTVCVGLMTHPDFYTY